MQTITIIAIVVVALLTVIIIGLAWLGFNSSLRLYEVNLAQGEYDEEIKKEYSHIRRKNFSMIASSLLIILLIGLFLTAGFISRMNNGNITVNNKTVLVIETGSMSDFYDDKYAESLNNDRRLQFSATDLCVFETIKDDTELVIGEVYGYKIKNTIITHRLVKINSDGTYVFRGDNNPTSDVYQVNKGSIIYHYTGARARGIGAFILYAQSYFGIWSILGIIGITISSEIILNKVDKMNKKRYRTIRSMENEEK